MSEQYAKIPILRATPLQTPNAKASLNDINVVAETKQSAAKSMYSEKAIAVQESEVHTV